LPPEVYKFRCDRYYQVGESDLQEQLLFNGDVTNGQTYQVQYFFAPHMRDDPTVVVTYQASASFNVGTIGLAGTARNTGFWVEGTANASAKGFFRVTWTASSFL
jgi:hypothetical protein